MKITLENLYNDIVQIEPFSDVGIQFKESFMLGAIDIDKVVSICAAYILVNGVGYPSRVLYEAIKRYSQGVPIIDYSVKVISFGLSPL